MKITEMIEAENIADKIVDEYLAEKKRTGIISDKDENSYWLRRKIAEALKEACQFGYDSAID